MAHKNYMKFKCQCPQSFDGTQLWPFTYVSGCFLNTRVESHRCDREMGSGGEANADKLENIYYGVLSESLLISVQGHKIM